MKRKWMERILTETIANTDQAQKLVDRDLHRSRQNCHLLIFVVRMELLRRKNKNQAALPLTLLQKIQLLNIINNDRIERINISPQDQQSLNDFFQTLSTRNDNELSKITEDCSRKRSRLSL